MALLQQSCFILMFFIDGDCFQLISISAYFLSAPPPATTATELSKHSQETRDQQAKALAHAGVLHLENSASPTTTTQKTVSSSDTTEKLPLNQDAAKRLAHADSVQEGTRVSPVSTIEKGKESKALALALNDDQHVSRVAPASTGASRSMASSTKAMLFAVNHQEEENVTPPPPQGHSESFFSRTIIHAILRRS